jgi:hypothetical protein
MASLFAAFDAAGITVHGVCAIGEDDTDADHFLVDDPDAAVSAAAAAGAVEVRRRDVLVVGHGGAGVSAGMVLRRIAQAGAGIDLFYLASDGSLVLGAIPLEAARDALIALGEEHPLA